MNDRFQTVSSAKKNIRVTLITCACLAAAGLLGLLVSAAVCIFIEAIILFMGLFMLLMVSKTKWLLEFEGTQLYITNLGNRQQYFFDNLCFDDFVFTQSATQQAHNCADLKIRGSSAVFNDVANTDAFRAYLSAHFQ